MGKIDLFGVEIGIFHENYVNNMATDALAPGVAMTSAAMVMTMHDKEVLVFHEGGFQLSIKQGFRY